MVYSINHIRRFSLFGRQGLYFLGGKRAVDLCIVILFLPIWLPFCTLLWGLAWLEVGKGGYVDRRIGQFGRSFGCLKIRTMRCEPSRGCAADKRLDDPRITPLGRVLRRSSLDELPQLWCVLKGEMSLIGPRPVPQAELERYGAQRGAYLQMRPGISGLWQVSGRNALLYSERIALDVEYCRNVSIWLDLKLMAATIFEILRLNGR